MEKEFQSWLGARLEADGWFYYKLPDTGFDYKPFDFIALSPSGQAHYCEAKITDGDTIVRSKFRNQQVTSLRKIAGLDPESAWGIVYSRSRNEFAAFKWTDFEASIGKSPSLRIWTS